jgi:hypothetical protein
LRKKPKGPTPQVLDTIFSFLPPNGFCPGNWLAGQRCDFNGLGVTTIAEPLSGSNFFGPFDRLEQTWTFSRPIVIDLDELAATVSAAAA